MPTVPLTGVLPRNEKVVGTQICAPIVIVQFTVVVFAVPLVESVTFAVKLNVPAAVGVPAIAPVERFKLSPPGSAPAVSGLCGASG